MEQRYVSELTIGMFILLGIFLWELIGWLLRDRMKTPKRRYFFVTTSGKEPNGSISFNAFDLKTDDGNHPTFKKCMQASKIRYPIQREVVLLNISEKSEEDWIEFLSEK
jgi:hypothetical protein